MYYQNIPSPQMLYPYLNYVDSEIERIHKYFPFLKRNPGLHRYSQQDHQAFIQLRGIMPIQYQQQSYNIPMLVFFPYQFPYIAPFIYVECLSNMRIYSNHPCVTNTGRVNHPTLTSWLYPTKSDIVASLQILQAEFGKIPPLHQQQPQYPTPQVRSPPCERDQNLEKQITSHWQDLMGKIEPFVYETLMNIKNNQAQHQQYSAKLIEGRSQLEEIVNKLDMEKAILESHTCHLEESMKSLKQYIEIAKESTKNKPSLDDSILPVSFVHSELIRTLSYDETAQDIYPILYKALQSNVISPDDYLQEIGKIADKQFKHRALCLKIIEYLK